MSESSASRVRLRRVTRNSGWLWAGNGVSMIAGVGQVALLSRVLGPEGVGTIGIFATVSGLGYALLGFVSAEAMTTFVSRALAKGDSHGAYAVIAGCYVLDVGASLVLVVLVAVFAVPLLGGLGVDSSLRWSLVWYSLTVPLSAVIVLGTALLRIGDRFSASFKVSVAANVGRLCGAVFVFVNGYGVAEAVWLYVGGAIIEALGVNVIGFGRLSDVAPSAGRLRLPDIVPTREFWRFEIQGYLRGSTKSLSRYLDSTILALLASPIAVGYYRVAKQMIGYMQNVADSLTAALYREYAQLWFEGRRDELRALTLRLLPTVGVAAAVLTGSVYLLRSQIVDALLGEGFGPAAPVLGILVLGVFVSITMSAVYSLPTCTGDARPALQASVIALVAQAVATLVLVPKLGAEGAAWAYVAYMVVWAGVLLPAVSRILRAEDGGVHV